jgi:hypothetical protein
VAHADPSGRIIAQSAPFIGRRRDRIERFELIERLQAADWLYLRDGRRPLLERRVPAPSGPSEERSDGLAYSGGCQPADR